MTRSIRPGNQPSKLMNAERWLIEAQHSPARKRTVEGEGDEGAGELLQPLHAHRLLHAPRQAQRPVLLGVRASIESESTSPTRHGTDAITQRGHTHTYIQNTQEAKQAQLNCGRTDLG